MNGAEFRSTPGCPPHPPPPILQGLFGKWSIQVDGRELKGILANYSGNSSNPSPSFSFISLLPKQTLMVDKASHVHGSTRAE
jgi:hypothetical protein